MVYVVVTNQTAQTIYCRDLQIRVPGKTPCSNGCKIRARREALRYTAFLVKAQPEFPRDQVINHALLDVRALTPRRPLEGWLLATGGPCQEPCAIGKSLTRYLRSLRPVTLNTPQSVRCGLNALRSSPSSQRGATLNCLKGLSDKAIDSRLGRTIHWSNVALLGGAKQRKSKSAAI